MCPLMFGKTSECDTQRFFGKTMNAANDAVSLFAPWNSAVIEVVGQLLLVDARSAFHPSQ